jgi:hypothetical protein
MAKVDADSTPGGRALAARFNVTGFPGLIWFVNGRPQPYLGLGRDQSGIVSWVISKTTPVPRQVDDVLCNNGQGCISQGDIAARCMGSNFASSFVFSCQCSSMQFIPPLCVSTDVQQLAESTQAQQFSGTSSVAAFLSSQARCDPGFSLCPARPQPAQVQQTERLRLLEQERNDTLSRYTRIFSDFRSRCKETNICPDVCPESCNLTNPSGCSAGCAPDVCSDCDSRLKFISTVNATLAQLQISIKRISNELPPDPSLIFSNTSNKCVQSIVQCFNTTSPTALINAVRSEAQFCSDSGLKFCPLLGCVSQDTPCIPLNSCPADRPLRCPFLGFKDGSPPCIRRNESCVNVSTTEVIAVSCPVGQNPCPNGLQCAMGDGQSPSFFRVHFPSTFSMQFSF